MAVTEIRRILAPGFTNQITENDARSPPKQIQVSFRNTYNRRPRPAIPSLIPITEYLHFARQHLRFLGFGFAMAFTSSAGQTYFIGVFGPSVREEFSLSHTDWGLIYMVGTLLSALVLPWSGGLLDRIALRRYALFVMGCLAVACFNMSLTTGPLFLIAAIFLLRQFGQGLSSHTAVTSMARYMTTGRGKAIAISSMGFSTGEALLPLLAVIGIAAIGWRTTYQLTAIGVLLLIPAVLWLLRDHNTRHVQYLQDLEKEAERAESKPSSDRRQMLREPRFYLLLPALMAPSYVATALFFHHLTLAEAKGWSSAWVTGSYWMYALSTIVASLSSGPLIDRFHRGPGHPLLPDPDGHRSASAIPGIQPLVGAGLPLATRHQYRHLLHHLQRHLARTLRYPLYRRHQIPGGCTRGTGKRARAGFHRRIARSGLHV